MTPRQFAAGFIRDHEGGLSLISADNGNWTSGVRGKGTLVGSKYGVTAPALAAHRNTTPDKITASAMAALSLDEAVDIGISAYYKAPGFDALPWDRVTASIFDMSWGAGPKQAIKLVQRMIGALPDGQLGPMSVASYDAWRGQRKEETAAQTWGDARNAFYAQIASNEGSNDPDRVFLKGWINRTAAFLPGTRWWKAW